jgi:hypothetical protein
MWSFKTKKQETIAEEAAPTADPGSRFVVPNYTRGSPYVQSNPVYADNPGINTGEHAYVPVTRQQAESGMATYPEAGKPPSAWKGYYGESWWRSEREEHARGEEGFPNPQEYLRMAPNPYFNRNVVNRPQRTPHEYSFLRRFDQDTLGKRELNGNHFSQATIGQSSEPLKGMVAPMRRRSTYRLEPTQFDVATIDDNSGTVPVNMTFTSPDVGFADRSYRLS